MRKTEAELGLNDAAASKLGKELCSLLKLSASDPECRNIEKQILENRLERKRFILKDRDMWSGESRSSVIQAR